MPPGRPRRLDQVRVLEAAGWADAGVAGDASASSTRRSSSDSRQRTGHAFVWLHLTR